MIETLSKDQPVTDTQPDREVLLDEIKPESNLVIELNSDSESVIASEDDNNDDNDDEEEMDEDDNDDVRSTDSGYWSSEDALNQALARRELILEETSMTFNRVLQSPIKTIIQGTRPYFNNTSTTTVVQPKLEPSPRKQVSRKSDSQQQESQTSVLSLFDQVTGRKGSSKLTEFQYEISSESQNDMELDSNILKAIEPTTYLQPLPDSTSSHAHDQVNNNDTNITAASKASGRTGNFSWKLQETTDFPYEFDDEYDEEEEEEDEGDYDHAPTPPTKVRRLQPVNEVNENLDSNLSTSEQLLDLRILSANSKATTQELDVNMKRKVEFHNNPQDPVDDRNKHIKTVLAINSSQNTSSNSNTQSEPSQDMVAERVTTEPFLPITATAAVRRERRASITPSPYLTPFTASKLLDTPDHYLYLPQVHIGNNFSTSNARRESRMSTTSEAEEQVDVNTPLFSIDALSPTANLQAFGSGHLGKTGNCRKFLQKLQHCRCISFELVFRRIPSASLRDRDKWASRISWFCGEDSSSYRGGVCSNVSLHQKPTSTWPARPTSSKATRTGMRDPHVLSGVSFNFGDNYGYYLPLPCSLPILFDSADDAQTTSAEMNASAKLQSLPLKCHWLISRFVGFESIFHRTPYLRIRSRGDDEVPAPVSLVRNPLLELNKYWVRVARQALLIEWKKGQCVEWRLLNEVMGKQGVTKVSTDMATKLSALRERDIIVNGSLEDPCIAVTILTHATGIYDMKKAEPSFVTSLAYPSELHYGVISGAAADAAAASVDPYNSRSCRLACYRATATMRAMARLTTSLMNYGSLELYRNIEMPLIFTTADMEFHGIGVDSAFFTDLKSNLEDRLKIIEYYFKYTQGSDFNVSSGKDKKKLLNNLLGSYRNFLNQTLRNMRIYDFDESSERYMSYMKCLEDAPKRLEKHPLVLLRKEHAFFLRSVLPFCEEIIGLRKFGGRVRATIDTIGTETGRLIVSDPPLQHVSSVLCTLCFIIICIHMFLNIGS